MQSVDFVPRVLQKDVAFSTLSLYGDIAGPKYELFSDILKRANDWLAERVGQVSLVTCEIIDNEGVFNHDHVPQGRHVISAIINTCTAPAFLRILRIWTVKIKDTTAPRQIWTSRCQLTTTEIVPHRLEAITGQSSPRFQRMSDRVAEFNETNHINNDEVLCVRTSVCRFTSRHCSLDTERLFWLAGADLDDVHTCAYLVVFSVRGGAATSSSASGNGRAGAAGAAAGSRMGRHGSIARQTFVLGFRDFAGDLTRPLSRRKHRHSSYRKSSGGGGGECPASTGSGQACSVQALTRRASQWTHKCKDRALLNLDTRDYCVNYKINNDKPSPERLSQLFDCPHVVNSLRTTTYRTRVVRAFYHQTSRTGKENIISGCKIFHSPNIKRVGNVDFGAFYKDRHSINGFDFDTISYHKWMNENVNNIIAMETTKLIVSGNEHKSPYKSNVVDASDLSTISANHHTNFVVFALHVYTNSIVKDLTPDPKVIRLPKSSCSIL